MKKKYILLILMMLFSSLVKANEITTTTTIVFEDCMLDIKVSPQQGGTTSPRPGNYFLQGCGGRTVKAIPNTGFKFIRWEWSGGSFFSYENPITIEDSGWIVAVFDRLEDIPPTKLIGKYTCSASPCYNYYCHPDFDIGMVWSVICDNDIYYLTKDWEWLWDCEATSWNIYMPEEGDTVTVVGEVSEATDNQDNPYINIEVEHLLPTKCFVEIICGEDTEETELLRNYRDNILTKFPEGRELIKLYYQWSPTIVKAMENDEEFKNEIKEMVNGVLGLVGETE